VIVAELVQPARVHLGGGLGHALTDLPTRVSTALAALSRPGRPLPVVAPARYGADASLAGALLAARLGGTDLVAERGEACAQAS
jgi:kanosamine 6-kinase